MPVYAGAPNGIRSSKSRSSRLKEFGQDGWEPLSNGRLYHFVGITDMMATKHPGHSTGAVDTIQYFPNH
jgi:hypothetical protein